MVFHKVLQGLTKFEWGLIGFYWVLPSIIGTSFTGSYRI